jgi:parallel beta-helix repeat protein
MKVFLSLGWMVWVVSACSSGALQSKRGSKAPASGVSNDSQSLAQQVDTTSGCKITIQGCPSGTLGSAAVTSTTEYFDTYEGANTNKQRCLQRVLDQKIWCQSNNVSAQFLQSGKTIGKLQDTRKVRVLASGTHEATNVTDEILLGQGEDKTILVPSASVNVANIKNSYVSGLTYRGMGSLTSTSHYSGGVVLNQNAMLQYVTVEKSKNIGIQILGNDVTLKYVTSQDNLNGISAGTWFNADQPIGWYTERLTLENCVIRRNNRGITNPSWWNSPNDKYKYAGSDGKWYVDPIWFGGGGKFSFTKTVRIKNLQSYENRGPGLWFDTHNEDVEVRDSYAWSNTGHQDNPNQPNDAATAGGIGFVSEINFGPVLFINNRVSGNSQAGISVWESGNVTLKNNEFIGNPMEFRKMDRGSANGAPAFSLYNVTITGNKLQSGSSIIGYDHLNGAGLLTLSRANQSTFLSTFGIISYSP